MIFLIHNIRNIVLAFSVLLALGIYLFITRTIGSQTLQDIRLTQTYALTAVTYLYLALLASPLYSAFPNLSFKPIHIRARRSLGQSTFLFAVLHAYFAFFKSLGGFEGLFYLGSSYLIPIAFSTTALIILGLMFATSFDVMVKKLGKYWKMLHRFVYLAGVLILIHALMLGTHFIDLSTLVPKVFFVALSILLVLEALRFDKYLATKFIWLPKFGTILVLVIGVLISASFYLRAPDESSSTSLGIHAQHIQLAKDLQQSSGSNLNLPNIPGVTGDRTLRFNVAFDHPTTVKAGQNTDLKFAVSYASNAAPEILFERTFEKPMHLIIVDQNLVYFSHLHPTQSGQTFEITTQFPSGGNYLLYTDFQPVGAIEQQFAFRLSVQGASTPNKAPVVDKNLTKVFGDYEVSLSYDQPLKASQLSVGKQLLSFTVKDTNTKKGVTTLKPYLNAFGHLVMIDVDDYQYVHVHPSNLTPPAPNENGGPKVDFMPLGLYRPINPGIYRIFAQFNPDGKLFVADFTIEVK